jgi:hypothetical protein
MGREGVGSAISIAHQKSCISTPNSARSDPSVQI